MGLFDGNKSEQIKYLDDERKKLWERIIHLENYIKSFEKEIKTRTPESEKEAKEHSRKAAEFRNRTEQRLEEASTYILEIKEKLKESYELKSKIDSLNANITEVKDNVEQTKITLDGIERAYLEKVESVEKQLANIDEVFEKHPELDEEITELEGYIQKIEENQKKSIITLTAINSRKTDIDDIHRAIFGYKDVNEAGDEIFVDGTKDELDKTYDNLKEELSTSQKQVDSLNSEYVNKYYNFVNSYKEKYEEIVKEIRELLPNALTAGLSSAFSKKKEEEVVLSKQLQKRFTLGIYLLIGISFLPVTVSIALLEQKTELKDVIMQIPRIVLAFVPMYIPALWITYSSSKKLNLSKRLIEEYAHKEVLSRTYEGLSNQISNIKDRDQSEELKVRLLTNFLQASAENPGKLISNYETSDHPVMEALEQSYKFQIAIDKLADIPGLGKISAILEKSAKNKLVTKADKIEKALITEVDEVI